MAPLLGMLGGAGLLLIWWSAWEQPEVTPRKPRTSRLEDLLRAAGIEKVSAAGLLASCLGVGVFTALAFFAATGSGPISCCFGLFGGWLPMAMVRWRARKRAAVLRQLWPDVVDHLRSAIRAGLSLPEALIQLGEKGPVELRHIFVDFGSDYRSGGQFDPSLTRLKDRLADPVADRIIEALRLTREVGGSDLGRLLGTLAEFLRESARTRRRGSPGLSTPHAWPWQHRGLSWCYWRAVRRPYWPTTPRRGPRSSWAAWRSRWPPTP